MPGRKCTVCAHPQVNQIDTAINHPVPFRRIASQFDIGYRSAIRHARNCLKLDVEYVLAEKRIERAISAYEENIEQLELARQLRLAAIRYLQDPDDPLRLTIVPQAHEIEIVYHDYNDMITLNNGREVPKKKKAMLSAILQSLAQEGFEPEKYQFKTIDIRKYALDAISTTDMVIDKFARMAGDYQKNRANENDPAQLAQELMERLIAQGWDPVKARMVAEREFPSVPKQIPARVG